MLSSIAARQRLSLNRIRFSTVTRPTHITAEERAALRAARRERGRQILQQQQNLDGAQVEALTATAKLHNRVAGSRWLWYVGIFVPTALVTWAVQDENSPPARLAESIGLAGWVRSKFEEMAVPQYDKLLPDWSQVSPCLLLLFPQTTCRHSLSLFGTLLSHCSYILADAECTTRHSRPTHTGH